MALMTRVGGVNVVIPTQRSTLYDGLFAYYPYDSSANDLSGNGHNGTVYGASNVSGKVNNCYSFDGTNDYITAPFSWSSGQPITISFWMYTSGAKAANQISAGGSSTTNRIDLFLFYSNGNSYFDYGNPESGGRLLFANPAGYYNSWVHVVATSGGGSMKVYFNNSQVASSASSSTPSGITTLEVGRRNPEINPDFYFAGKIDELAFWNRVITATEIQELYNGGNGISL